MSSTFNLIIVWRIQTSELGVNDNSSANRCARLSRNVIDLFFCELIRLRILRTSVDVSTLQTFSSGNQASILF